MSIIKNNPYRTVGLLVGATAREQTKQINRLKNFIEADQDLEDDYSFPAFGNFNRTIKSVEDAASKLNLDNDKINAALFWFWNGNRITDEAAFENLKSGDIDAANEIWDKLISKTDEEGKRIWKPVTEKNYSAFHNYSVLNIIRSNGNLHNAIVASLYFLESDLVNKFVLSVADETYKTNKKELQLRFLNQFHSNLEANKKTSLPVFLEILGKQEFVAKQDYMNGFAQKHIEQIELKVELTKNKRKTNKADGAEAGQNLYTSTVSDLTQLKNIVGSTDLKFTSISDKVANEILQCSIDYFNESQEKDSSSDYAETAIKLAKHAEILAIGKITKDRVVDTIETLEEMKDKEISQAIQVLKSIKDAYDTNKADITAKVRKQEQTDIQIIMGAASINWGKVNQMIENSINWNKAVELVQEVVPRNNIEKIKNVKNQANLNEYKSLVDFLLSKLTNSNQIKVSYLRFWKAPTSSSSQNDFEFAPNAWWILGLAGLFIGTIAGGGGGAVVGALIGAGIGSIIKNN